MAITCTTLNRTRSCSCLACVVAAEFVDWSTEMNNVKEKQFNSLAVILEVRVHHEPQDVDASPGIVVHCRYLTYDNVTRASYQAGPGPDTGTARIGYLSTPRFQQVIDLLGVSVLSVKELAIRVVAHTHGDNIGLDVASQVDLISTLTRLDASAFKMGWNA